MLVVPTYLSTSSVHGIGVYAKEDMPKGTLIWVMDERFDILIPQTLRDEVNPLQVDFINTYCYPYSVKAGYFVLETDDGRFMNHSLNPNTDFSTYNKGVTTRDIKKGEELFCNYYDFCETFEGYTEEDRMYAREKKAHRAQEEVAA